MLQTLKEMLGTLSGYKQKYEETKWKLTMSRATIKEAEGLADKILKVLKGDGSTGH